MRLVLPRQREVLDFFAEHKSGWTTCGLLVLLILPLETLVKPLHRHFRLDDPQIAYPFEQNELVPAWLLVLLSAILPVAIIIGCCKNVPRLERSLNISLLGFTFAFASTVLVTDISKFLIGNPRPDFLARCIPRPGTPTDTYVKMEVCSTKNLARLEEGFRSTPSGHSSVSFCGLVFLSLWVSYHFQMWAKGTALYVSCLSVTPVLLALCISLSRIADYKHHWYDVLLGLSLGSAIALCSFYRLHLSSDNDDDDENVNAMV